MLQIIFRRAALARFAVFCLGTSALTMPALAANFSVGGGTITTTQADNSIDDTGASGGFALQPNTTGSNDSVTISGVTINNTSGAPSGRALDLGYTLSSSGPYSVTMHGSNLTSAAGSGVAAFIESSAGGNISFDSTGGAANTVSGPIGINLNGNGGNVSIKTGADTITTSGEILYATTTGAGTISIDSIGATLTSNGSYGISAVSGGSGTIMIGALNGGIAGTINVANGSGIFTSSGGNQSITLASSGVINALNGMTVQGNTVVIDSFGTINATNNAIAALNGTGPLLTVTLESGSVTSGEVLGGFIGNTFNIVAGANITNATFNGNGGPTSLNLEGSGNATFSLSSASNITGFQMAGTGVWTLTGSPTGASSFTVTSGTLRLGAGVGLTYGNAVIVNGGTFDLNGQTETVGALSGTGGAITLGSGSLTVNSSANTSLAAGISGNGSLIKAGTGMLTLAGTNTYTGGTIITSGTLALSGTGSIANSSGVLSNGTLDISGTSGRPTIISLSGNGVVNLGSKSLDLANASGTFAGAINGTGEFNLDGGSEALTGANTYSGGTLVRGGTLQVMGPGTLGATSGSLTMSGGTLDLGGTTQIQNGGVNMTGGTIQNGTLSSSNGFNLSEGATVTATLTGTGGLNVVSAIPFAAVTLGGVNTYTGGTGIGQAILQLSVANALPSAGQVRLISGAHLDLEGHNQTIGGLTGSAGAVDLQGATLTIAGSSSTFFNGGIMDSVGGGSVVIASGGNLDLTDANTYTGLTVINSGGQLQIGNNSGANLTGSIAGSVLDNGTLTLNPLTSMTFANAVSGTGNVIITGGGTVTVSAADTYTGSTTINSGATLALSGIGAIPGSSVTDNGTFSIASAGGGVAITTLSGSGAVALGANTLTLTNASGTFSGASGGTGGLALNGGTETLTGTNFYTGATSVNAGTLNITGSTASSSVNVASSATMTGTGKVGTTTVASGGTLTPGSSTTPGTLSVSGNLTLASGSNYLDAVTPTAAGLTSVSGAATINGNAIASFTSGTYTVGQRYTLLTASGGVSGSFSSISTPGIPTYVRGQLSYDANDVYLNIAPNALSSLLTNTTGNQHNVVAAIDAAVTAGAAASGGFLTLYGLSGTALNSAVDQISGRIGPNVSNSVGQSFLSFLSVTAQGGSGDGASFAPGSAYGEAGAPHRAQLGTGETRVWGAVYGGHVGLSGDATSGAASLSSNNVGLIGGADMQFADGLLGGVTLGLGRQSFNSGNGSGNSNDYMLGLYGRANVGRAYLAASLGYGWHQITTLRVVTVSGTDVLQGKQNADDFGGRIEAGWRMALGDGYSTTPYAAFAGESFESPAYGETALSGAPTFALSYASHSSSLGRSELGAHLDHDYGLDNGVLAADARVAWAHQLDDLPFTQASFQNLPGAAFQVAGVRPDRDTALLGLDLQVQNSSGLFFGVKGEGQFGAGTTLLEGMGNFGWRW